MIENLKEKIEEYKEKINKAEEELEEQKNKINNHEVETKGQEKIIEEKQAKIEYLTNRISKQEMIIKMLEKQLEERLAMYERLKGLTDQTNATPDQLLYGRIAYSMGGLITGTMPNRLDGTGTVASKGSYSPSTSGSNGYEATTTTAMTTSNTTLTLGLNDTLTLPYGFYSKPITIRNGIVNRGKLTGSMLLSLAKTGGYKGYYSSTDIPVNNTITASSYTGANNETAPASTTYNQDSGNTINLGVNQKLTIPTGYYHKGLTINNGVINRGKLTGSMLLSLAKTGDYKGYYSSTDIPVNNTITASNYTGGNNETAPASTTYNQDSGNTINLGVNQKLTIPTGYYHKGLTINNGVINRGTINETINAGQTYTTSKAGYYTAITVKANSLSSQTPATVTAAQILSGHTAWANGEKITGTMPNIGTYTYPRNGEVGFYQTDLGTYNWVHIPEGYYASDSTDWAPEVRLNDDHVIQLARSNPRIYRGRITAVLDSNNNRIILPAGYYEESEISTDITGLNANITYTHHVHQLNTAAYTITNNSFSPDSVPLYYADDEKIETSGGCFTIPCYHIQYSESGTGTCGGAVVTGCPRPNDPTAVVDYCTKCGREWGAGTGPATCNNEIPTSSSADYWTTDANDHPEYRSETKYIRSCGKTNGQIVAVTASFE